MQPVVQLVQFLLGHPWLLVGLIVLVVVLVSRSGGKTPKVEPHQCKGCRTRHPAFARFCRRCGKQLAGGGPGVR